MMEFYRRHPIAVWVFGIGAFLVVIWALFSRATSSQVVDLTPNTVIQQGPSPDAQLAASTTIQTAQIAAQADAKRSDNETLLARDTLAVQGALAQLGLDNDDRNADRQYNLNVFSIASGERISMAELQQRSDELSITAGLEAQRDRNATALEMTRITSNANVNQALINSNVAMAESANNAQVSLAKQETKRSNTSSILGAIGGIASIFSDRNLKTGICRVGERNGLPVYEFYYTAHALALDPTLPRGRVRGHMAQDAMFSPRHAAAVGTRDGFLTLNYGAL